MECRICGRADEITQARLDELIRIRTTSHDLCAVCWAKYGEYEATGEAS